MIPLFSLRTALKKSNHQGMLVPLADHYQNEYVPKSAKRLEWLTGFTGSAGFAIVLQNTAALFVDGRYTLQAPQEVDTTLFSVVPVAEQSPQAWLAEQAQNGDRIAYDPWLHTADNIKKFTKALDNTRVTLDAIERNPIDALWIDQPPQPTTPIVLHVQEYAGKSWQEKLAESIALLHKQHVEAVVLSNPASICWLLNIRANDVPHTPLSLGYAIVHTTGNVQLFTHPAKVSDAIREHFGAAVTYAAEQDILTALQQLSHTNILLDKTTAPSVFAGLLPAAILGDDPCTLPKAIKNETEIAGTRAAHKRDGAALTKFLQWLQTDAVVGSVTEMECADKLESFRRATNQLKDLSFPTIAGSGGNGAIVHYRATPKTNRTLQQGDIFLLDSGAQYLDGTTDVTRTVFIGNGMPTREQQDRFTRVLKGHIAIATARFPKGTTGAQLDTLARIALWQAGLDYDHGTGHGVGSYSSVHEAPIGISKRYTDVALVHGMIVSNEPGYYKTGDYGIRLENLVLVREDLPQPAGGERHMLGFETLTLAPFDERLIAWDLLTAAETAWLAAYQAQSLQNAL
jgi:Xaa-Pro aminopeptidase